MRQRGGRRVVAAGVLALALLAALGVWGLSWWSAGRAVTVPYAAFRSLLEAGQVERVVVRGQQASVALKQAVPVPVLTTGGPATREARAVRVRVPEQVITSDTTLMALIQRQRVDLRFEQPSQWPGILLNFLPVLLLGWTAALLGVLVGLGWWAVRRAKVANP